MPHRLDRVLWHDIGKIHALGLLTISDFTIVTLSQTKVPSFFDSVKVEYLMKIVIVLS